MCQGLWIGAAALFVLMVLHGTGHSRPAYMKALAPWTSNTHPTDAAKQHAELVTSGCHEYTVTQGGTMDGTNCRSPVGVYEAWEQTWESNRAVRMENVGEADVVNPWLSNGRNDFRTIEDIVASAVEPGMSDREKAIALWYQETQHRYHWTCGDNEVKTPVKVFNVYGHNTCGDDSNCLAGLWKLAGLRVRPARIMGHCVTQVFYDGAWHLMDGDMHSLYLLRDNHTIADEQSVVRDHDLIKRTHTHGIRHPEDRSTDEREAALYVYEGDAGGTRDAIGSHRMDMVLRPGEALVWRWGHLDPVKYHGSDAAKFPDTIANGLWEYRPDFGSDAWRRGAESVEDIRDRDSGLTAEPGKTGVVVWRMRSPYVFVGGRLEVEGVGAKLALSWDGQEWHDARESLDELFPPDSRARYEYLLRCELTQDARLESLGIINDLQMAPLSLPAMVVGENRFVYTDESPEGRNVRITHDWVERSASAPPGAPPSPVYPPDGGEINGTDIAFEWTSAADPDGGEIADYHFELFERSDMKWPLSPSFGRLISKTADSGNARYTLPYVGLLTPDRRYYWRVRAKNGQGVWGPWSKTWSFTALAPAPPIDVTVDFDPERCTGVLRWEPSPEGRQPVRYRVYGSDEKGFSISDVPYEVDVGNQDGKLPTPFPANFIAETSATELAVVGAGVELPEANEAYYRVVAVDEHGKRSGPSDYASAPRPVICSGPVTAARVGKPYEYRVSAVRSLGDLRARRGLAMGFWDIEEPRFSIEQGPQWLSIDETTGLLSGVPDAPGRVEVIATAVIDREVRVLDERRLSWGRERVLEVRAERVGTASQRFVIKVAD